MRRKPQSWDLDEGEAPGPVVLATVGLGSSGNWKPPHLCPASFWSEGVGVESCYFPFLVRLVELWPGVPHTSALLLVASFWNPGVCCVAYDLSCSVVE